MQDWKACARVSTLALVIAGCGDGGGDTSNPFGQNPSATNATTMSGGTAEPATGGSSTGEAPTSGATGSTSADSSGTTMTPLTSGVSASCGDSVVDAGEECDDGNDVDGGCGS